MKKLILTNPKDFENVQYASIEQCDNEHYPFILLIMYNDGTLYRNAMSSVFSSKIQFIRECGDGAIWKEA